MDGELVIAAVAGVGVVPLVTFALFFDDSARLLRGGGAIEKDERLAVGKRLVEDRELPPNGGDVDRFAGGSGSRERH